MNLLQKRSSTPIQGALVASAATLAGLTIANYLVARRTERLHPPEGSFLEVDGVRLHYSDRGRGSPIILIHGNVVAGNDYDTSGLSDLLLKQHRVIIFDRPGFGHRQRPYGQIWTADKQADLLHRAFCQLGVERPVVVGHSWGAIVALALATRHQADVAGVVALSGYYFWTLRPDVLQASLGAVPIVGDILRYTVSPLLTWLMMPLIKRGMFSPSSVPARFEAEFSTGMAARPSQIRAISQDGALMIQGALSLRDHYKGLTLPVTIVAGEDDKVVFARRAKQLQASIKGSVLHLVPGGGHMIHYQATVRIAEAVEAVVELAFRPGVADVPQGANISQKLIAV